MFFYHFNELDHFIGSNLIHNLKIEKENIQQIMNLYENKKSNLLAITTNMVEVADSITKTKLTDFYDTISSLKKSFESIHAIESLATKLEDILKETISLYDHSLENNKDAIKANLVEYNKQRDELFHKILEFENTNTMLLNASIELSLNASKRRVKKNSTIHSIFTIDRQKIDIELEPHDNHTLIISEKEQKAYLPFFYSEVKAIYENSNTHYQTLQDVVNERYIIPLRKFKNSAIARFRESFHLIREKEKGSITQALDLGLELMFRYELNPIIIAACRNLDELDIYLDCLEQNELDDFTCFEIKFEVMPQLIKNRKTDL